MVGNKFGTQSQNSSENKNFLHENEGKVLNQIKKLLCAKKRIKVFMMSMAFNWRAERN
jgi:hypothetical protein